jgi:tetratricopeptide (TPR) repeat protein
MNDTDQIETLKALTEVAREREHPREGRRLASVRVSPGSYLAAASVLTFGSALLLRSEQDVLALAVLGLAWLVVPILAFTDRIEFDGRTISRRGPAPFIQRLIAGRQKQLRIEDFERVDTQALRTIRRRGRVRYRYRTQVNGKNTEFTFASGGRSYREMISQLLPRLHQDKLDLRTLELRDYLCDPRTLNREVESLHLASVDVLDDATLNFKLGRNKQNSEKGSEASPPSKPADGSSAVDSERAILLGALGNKLRVAGRLNQAREAFRRALIISPGDGRMIFDFARLLRSQASSLSDAKLLSRARAALRLSEMRAGNEPGLLALIGESFLEWGETTRAQHSFQKAIDLEAGNFRSRIGLANLALRDGKLAHVIHQYREAARASSEKGLAAYARREADYYASLNDDDDFLSVELRRINWLQHALRVRRLAARVTNASILVALIAPYVESSIAGICWSLASSSLVAWISSLFAMKLLATRRRPRLEGSV